MNTAVVGAARVVFGADTSEFDAKAKGVEGVLGRLVETFRDVEKRLKQVGLAATVGITVPFAGMVATIDKGAGQFQAAMNKVAAALPKATAAELDALSDAARRLGPAVGKSATEAAEAVDALARAGVSAADILGGALDATLKLSAAGFVDAAASAGLVTDVMGQFGKTAADLPTVMTQVVGVLDATKMDFDDFRLAVGQGGSIAAASGIDFLDFATTIAATSTQFASGADAGTSYKTFLQALTPNSKAAERAMRDLGISFFDARGNIKPMAEQAEMLKRAMEGLSDEQRSEKLKDIFGADAARTAIGLMNQGREGYEAFRATVAGGDVEAKVAKAMEGTEQAGKNISNAWQEVKIAFGVDTGLIDIIARIKNGFANLLLSIANLPVGVRQAGIAIAALGAAIGPLIWAVAHVGAAIVANFAAAKFGVIGRVLGLLISPVSTIVSLLGEYGLSRVVTMLASRLLALTGPIGWVIGGLLLFKDNIVAGLRAVWAEITTTLGPPLAAIMEKVQGIFAKLSGGTIGASIGGLMDMLGALKDFIGNGLTAGILVAGEIIERVLGVIVAAIGGLVDVVSGVVDVISALLQGDFAGAWEAVRGIVESVIDAVVDMVAALVPELGAELQAVYALAKQWLADGFASISGWVGDAVASMVNYVASAFPGVVAAAKSVYAGVKGWLVDNFAGVVAWVRGAVKEIVGWYNWMAKAIGLDAALANAGPEAGKPAAPVEPKAPPPPAPAPRMTAPGGDDGKTKKAAGGAGRTAKAKERDAAEDAADRARIASQNALEAARLRGDRDAEEALRRQLDLEQQIEAYKRTGLSVAAATAAATRDLTALDAARRVGLERELALDQAEHELEVAKVAGNRSLVETLERQDEIAGRIRAFQREGLSLVEATLRAGRQQLDVDEARAQVRARLLADEAQDRAAELARLRGDSEADQRKLQRDIDIRKRAREIEQRDGLAHGQGVGIATTEWSEADRARQTGEFRTVFKDGLQAAMSGDLKGFISNWWKERVAKGMEDALNSLAALAQKLFSAIGGGGSGKGFFSAIGAALGLAGKSGSGSSAAAKLPGFRDGGSFRVAGRSGIDANLVAFRATRGEMVDIRHGNDNGPAGAPAVVELRVGAGEVFDARVAAVSGDVQVKTARSTNERAAMAARQNLNG